MFERQLIKSLAKKYNLTTHQVQNIIYSSHKFVEHVIKDKSDRKNSHFPSVRVLGLGIFYCPPDVKYSITKYNKQKYGSSK